jgi:hypothetical protein
VASIRKFQLTIAGGVLSALAACADEPSRPAVRLMPAQAVSPIEAITIRAAEPRFDPLAPGDNRGDGRATSRNDAPRMRDIFNDSKADDNAAKPGPWKKFTKWVDDKASNVKRRMDAPPADQPPPRVGQVPPVNPPTEQKTIIKGGLRSLFQEKPVANVPNNAVAPKPDNPAAPATNATTATTDKDGFFKKLFKDEPQQPQKPEAPKPNAANPAFRWYGYGSTTPGQNAYAPTGDYPNGSAQWFQQSGATPGAFPVPNAKAPRPANTIDAPAYIPNPVPSTNTFMGAPPVPTLAPPTPAPTFAPPARRTIAETRPVPTVPNVVTPMNAVPPVPQVPSVQSPLKQEPVWRPVVAMPTTATPNTPPTPATLQEPVRPPEPTWKPLETQNMIVPVIRGSEPHFDDSPLAKRIKAACEGKATKVTIRETGPRQLVIRFEAKTVASAEAAASAVAALAELKPFSIDFEAGVPQR